MTTNAATPDLQTMPQHLTPERPMPQPQTTEDGPFISYAQPLEGRYQATKIGTLALSLNGKPWIAIPIYANNPLPAPAGCPTCAKATSLMPDLSQRAN